MRVLRSPSSIVAGLAWLVAWLPIVALSHGEARASLLFGWGLAGVTGALSFGLLAYANGRPLQAFLKSVVGGFLARLILVAGGVVWAIHRGYNAAWLCVSFFTLYWVFFACEYLTLERVMREARS